MRLLFFVALLCFPALAQIVPPNPDPSVVTVDAQAAIVSSRTGCATVVGGAAAINAWSLAPADVTAASTLWMVRYVTIQHLTASLTPFTTEILAGQVGGTALPGIDGLTILSGQSWQPQVRRPVAGSLVGGTYPTGPIPIWLRSSQNVRVCATFSW